MPRLFVIIFVLLILVLGGGIGWFGFADIKPPVQTVQLEIPNDRFAR
jgi:hypothetical protein